MLRAWCTPCLTILLLAFDTPKVPEDWPYAKARELFVHPEITPPEECDFKWVEPDVEGLVEFMCKKNGFDEAVRDRCAHLKCDRGGW